MAEFDAVFEGGGAKGVAFAGALTVLNQRGHRLRRVLGTSAGAITATLCAAGYTPDEMLAAVQEKLPDHRPRFSCFMDIPSAEDFPTELRDRSLAMEIFRSVRTPLVPDSFEKQIDERLLDAMLHNRIYARLFSFYECGGFYAGREFLKWIDEKLALKGIQAGDTLATFAAKTGADLSLVVTDTTDVEMLVLNHRTAPGVPAPWAVRMSMSIPFVWQEVLWQPAWGPYLGRPKAGNVIVDGGVLSNFPIRLIAGDDSGTRAIMGDTDPAVAHNLGLLIDERIAVPGAPDTPKTPVDFTSVQPIRRLARLLDTMMGAWDTDAIRKHEAEICRLPAKGYGTLEFDMAGQRLEVFLQAARDAMTRHLDGRGF